MGVFNGHLQVCQSAMGNNEPICNNEVIMGNNCVILDIYSLHIICNKGSVIA